MRKNMIVYILTTLLNQFIKNLDTDDLRRFLDRQIDVLEDVINNSENKYDDSLLPGLRLIRELFNIPDYEDN